MEDSDERAFFNALHHYIQRVVTENPSGTSLLNVTEGSERATMASSLNRIINSRIADKVKELERKYKP